MDHFSYQNGELWCEGVPVDRIAAEVGTPTYVYSSATLSAHYRRLAAAFAPVAPLLCFSVKSCPNLHVLRALVRLGSGLDVVSGGELHRAVLAGCPREKIVFAGVGKTEAELREALGSPGGPVGLLNIESEEEMERAATIAAELGVTAHGALRVNPDVDAHTHRHTTTGTAETKFGVGIDRAAEFFARHSDHTALRLTGLHLHLGSPIYQAGPYVRALEKTLELMERLAAAGTPVATLDLGGGFAADYTTGRAMPATEYASALVPMLAPHVARGLRVILEPGRTIVANAGILLTTVQYLKQADGPDARRFVICDAGMQTLLRPALYDAFHFIWPTRVKPSMVPSVRAERPDLAGLVECDVVGPICETADHLARRRALPPVRAGELLAVFGAGAYGMSMASRYNSHPLPAEVLVEEDRWRVVRRRETYHDLVVHELE